MNYMLALLLWFSESTSGVSNLVCHVQFEEDDDQFLAISSRYFLEVLILFTKGTVLALAGQLTVLAICALRFEGFG
jgi:hypothetical protein